MIDSRLYENKSLFVVSVYVYEMLETCAEILGWQKYFGILWTFSVEIICNLPRVYLFREDHPYQ